MPLFSDMPDELYANDRDILLRMEKSYQDSITMNLSFWGEADLDTRYEAGDATLWNEVYNNMPANRRRNFNFNRIRRVISMMDGYQRRNRKSTIVVPIENASEHTADQFTKTMLWIDKQQGISETISSAFHGALVTGMNLLQLWVDYRSDPINGEIKLDNCSYNSFLIDPYFRKSDLSDCSFIWKRTYLTKSEAKSLMPDKAEEIESLYGVTNKDGKFKFMPETYNFGAQNLLSYDEYYYRDYRTQRQLVDVQTGETMEWKSEDDSILKRILEMHPQLSLIESEIPTVKMAIVIQDRVMYHGPNVSGLDSYPFIPVLGYYTPQLPYFPWRIQGVVRGLRDAQYLYNRRKIIELDILESQVNSGWIAKENVVINSEDLYKTGQGQVIFTKFDANIGDVVQIQAPQVPPSMIELSKQLATEIQEISGVSEELLGSATDDSAGILSMLRQGAGLTTLQGLFDGLDYAQKLLGKQIIKLIQNNFTPGKMKRILGEDPSQEFYTKTFGNYDSAVEEGYNTTTQRQMQFAQIMQLKEMGVPIPDENVIDAATIQDKKKIRDAIVQNQQQQMQQQQQQFQMQMADMEAKTKLVNAQAAADTGLGLERMSRIQENSALAEERRAKAVHDLDAGALDKARALKELQAMDLDQLEKTIQLLAALKSQTKQDNLEMAQQQPQMNLQEMMNMMGSGSQQSVQPQAQQSPMQGV